MIRVSLSLIDFEDYRLMFRQLSAQPTLGIYWRNKTCSRATPPPASFFMQTHKTSKECETLRHSRAFSNATAFQRLPAMSFVQHEPRTQTMPNMCTVSCDSFSTATLRTKLKLQIVCDNYLYLLPLPS